MKPRMSAKRAIAVCGPGPKTEAQRTQALAALRHLHKDMALCYPDACSDTVASIKAAGEALKAAPLRGQS